MNSVKLLSLFVIILVGIIISSCADSSNQKRKMTNHSLLIEEDYDECVNQPATLSPVTDKILRFDLKFNEYLPLVRKKYPQILSISSANYFMEEVFTPVKPLVLSSPILENQFQNFLNQFKMNSELDYIYEQMISYGSDVPDMTHESMLIFLNLERELGDLKNHAIRLKHGLCKKKQLILNRKFDFIPYIDKTRWGNAYYENEEFFFKLAQEDLPLKYWEHFFTISKDSFQTAIGCQRESNELHLIVRVFEENLDNQKMIKESIESSWQTKDIKTKILFADRSVESALKIHWINSYSSYVDHRDLTTIVLGVKNEKPLLSKILAHEFGHVVGFNDCYVEFFNELEQLIYYELNALNPMCSIRGKSSLQIPGYYLQQMALKHCHNF